MDYIGLIRRGVGAVGAFLVAFGLASQADATSASSHVTEIIGGIMFLVDFGTSVFGKIGGNKS
jgi:hypothetical protein